MSRPETAPAPLHTLLQELERQFYNPQIHLWESAARLLPDAAGALSPLQHSLFEKLLKEVSHFATFRKLHFYPFLSKIQKRMLNTMELSSQEKQDLDSYLQDVRLQHQRLKDLFYRCCQVATPIYESESASYILLRNRLQELEKRTDEWIFREEAELLPQLFCLK